MSSKICSWIHFYSWDVYLFILTKDKRELEKNLPVHFQGELEVEWFCQEKSKYSYVTLSNLFYMSLNKLEACFYEKLVRKISCGELKFVLQVFNTFVGKNLMLVSKQRVVVSQSKWVGDAHKRLYVC